MNSVKPAILCLVTVVSSVFADPIPESVRDHVNARVKNGYCVGLVVGVVDENGTTYFSRGTTDKSGNRPVSEDTIFEIGSITKAFTAIALTDMAERGLVSLDDPAQKFLPDPSCVLSRGDKQITLRHLANHTSGLPRLPENLDPADDEDPYADYTEKKMLEFLSEHKIEHDIGTRYEYSNLGAGLLGYALARRAETTYEELMVDRICDPLGMKDTRINLSADQVARLAKGHIQNKPAKNWTLDSLAGAGALRSTARDMLRFLSANMGLAESSVSGALKASHEGRTETEVPDLYVALGWHVWTKFGTTIIWHNGGTGGYRSFCGFSPEKKRGVVVLTNTVENIDDIGMHLLEPKYTLRELRGVVSVKGELLDEYVGYYELAPGVVFDVTRDGGQLFAQLTGQDRAAVFPESESKFFYKVVDAQLSFFRGEDGKVDHLILHQNGDHKARKLSDYKPPVRVEIAVEPKVLADYVGKYQLAVGAEFDVRLDENRLTVKLSGQPRFPVFAESETKFFYKVVEAQLTFVRDESGKVTSLILHQAGMNQTARKIE